MGTELPRISATFLLCPRILAGSQSKHFCSSCGNGSYLDPTAGFREKDQLPATCAESLTSLVHSSPPGRSAKQGRQWPLRVRWATVFQGDSRETALWRHNLSTTKASAATLGRKGNREPILAPYLSLVLFCYFFPSGSISCVCFPGDSKLSWEM